MQLGVHQRANGRWLTDQSERALLILDSLDAILSGLTEITKLAKITKSGSIAVYKHRE